MPGSSPNDGGSPLGQPSAGPTLPAAFGRYRVLRLIGEGAMGRVLLAHDPVLDRAVALKHLRDDLRIPREAREALVVRMRHEARAAARVTHPNLVTLHDMGEDPEFGLYLVFEYVEGPTLKQRLLDGPLSPAQAARLARELGEALTLAHAAGIVHRDVKPENIILSSTGGKVADFGIARIPDSTLTHQGGLMGTPAYSAPETFRVGNFSPASDQFSLAAVMYEAISGTRAFPGDDAVSVAARIGSEEPPHVSRMISVSPAIDQVLARGLSKKPEERYPSCEAFGAAFAASVDASAAGPASRPAIEAASAVLGDAPDPRRAGLLDSDFPPRERKTGQVVLGAAVVVATAALLVRTALRSTDPPAEQPEEPAIASPSASSAASSAPRPRPSPPPRSSRPKGSQDPDAIQNAKQDPGDLDVPGLGHLRDADAGAAGSADPADAESGAPPSRSLDAGRSSGADAGAPDGGSR